MLNLTMPDIYQETGRYFWPTIRLLALFGTAPFFSEQTIPKKVKTGLALLVAILIGQHLPPVDVDLFSLPGVWTVMIQLIIGAMMGLSMTMMFSAISLAGDVIGMQMGLSFATFYDPGNGQNAAVLSRFLNILGVLLFLAFNGHLWMLNLLAQSFDIIPVTSSGLDLNGLRLFVVQAGEIFALGLLLGLPVIALLLTVNLMLGILTRLAPQLSIFAVGFPITLAAGSLTVAVQLQDFAPFFSQMLYRTLEQTVYILRVLA